MDKKKIRILTGAGLGAILGFAYFFFIGCKSGSCAITSSPYISTAYGALIGLVFMWPDKKESTGENEETDA